MAEHQKYRITGRIDAGGMAEVFRGVAESLQGFKKSVAIKRILPSLCKNKKFISMFLDEARLSLHLQHANIVGVFDIGVAPPTPDGTGGSYFIVMEYVDGSHLKGIIESLRSQGRPLPVAQAIYILMQVCSGLSYAHDVADPETGRPLGIVHRDISPPNILLSKNGEVKLVDFGLAKASSQLESTDPGMVKGKFSYLSPEAAHGHEVDRRADIFAVGILLYELLTGRRLFYGETDYQTVELVRLANVPSIHQQNPEVEPELEAVVRKALARDAAARYQTAGELQDALARYLFSRGLKVTAQDIGDLVRGCVAERARSRPMPVLPKSLIDELILDELNKFTSLDAEALGAIDDSGPGARPLSPEDLSPSGESPVEPVSAQPSGPLVDTTSWIEELTGEVPFGEVRAPRRSARPSSKRLKAVDPEAPPHDEAPPVTAARVEAPPTPRQPNSGERIEDVERAALPAQAPLVELADATMPAETSSGSLAAVLAVLAALVVLGGGALLWLTRLQAGP